MSYQETQFNNTKFQAVVKSRFQHNPRSFLVDVLIYGKFPSEFQTAHYDKSINYIAFVSFADNYSRCSISWNLDPKKLENYKMLHDYMENNEKEIINTAIKAFKQECPSLQPNKSWV